MTNQIANYCLIYHLKQLFDYFLYNSDWAKPYLLPRTQITHFVCYYIAKLSTLFEKYKFRHPEANCVKNSSIELEFQQTKWFLSNRSK